ncbi:hypothetical protein ADA01nite_29090 [Aneurinibacillus danicus]|uniref:Uncharacterized protein n=1 Tax=Aneurinibacillus danicus TaxID=267746 RepID=A0A511V9F2_9BACL|nr:hypothetical protein ADA01nite_29090 [Aneurinibacillus danicus]
MDQKYGSPGLREPKQNNVLTWTVNTCNMWIKIKKHRLKGTVNFLRKIYAKNVCIRKKSIFPTLTKESSTFFFVSNKRTHLICMLYTVQPIHEGKPEEAK